MGIFDDPKDVGKKGYYDGLGFYRMGGIGGYDGLGFYRKPG